MKTPLINLRKSAMPGAPRRCGRCKHPDGHWPGCESLLNTLNPAHVVGLGPNMTAALRPQGDRSCAGCGYLMCSCPPKCQHPVDSLFRRQNVPGWECRDCGEKVEPGPRTQAAAARQMLDRKAANTLRIPASSTSGEW